MTTLHNKTRWTKNILALRVIQTANETKAAVNV